MRRHPPGLQPPRSRPRPDASGSIGRVVGEPRERHAPDEPLADVSGDGIGEIARRTRATSVSSSDARASEQRRAPKCRTVGGIGDEPEAVAKRVQQLACTADVIVWAHEEKIFAASAHAAAKVLPELTIGVYGAGVLLAEIEDDIERFGRRAREA